MSRYNFLCLQDDIFFMLYFTHAFHDTNSHIRLWLFLGRGGVLCTGSKLLCFRPAATGVALFQRNGDTQAIASGDNSMTSLATFGSGCFWCTEAIFKDLKGVTKVTSGYAGGTVANPTYKQVCSGGTGHAEVIQLEFDPTVIGYDQLAEVFFLTHDPTSMNRQGGDTGEQYRSIIFAHDEMQQTVATQVKNRIDGEKIFDKPIVTQIVPFSNFYPAEQEHQEYYAKNPEAGYCQVVIDPKLAKFRKKFSSLLKSNT